MVCDKKSSAAKGFYSPSQLVSCLNIAYMEKSQWYFECVCIIFLSRGDSNMISRNHEWLIWVLLITKTSVWFLFLISTFDCGYSRRFCFLHFNTLSRYLFSPDCVQSSVLDTGEGGYWKRRGKRYQDDYNRGSALTGLEDVASHTHITRVESA